MCGRELARSCFLGTGLNSSAPALSRARHRGRAARSGMDRPHRSRSSGRPLEALPLSRRRGDPFPAQWRDGIRAERHVVAKLEAEGVRATWLSKTCRASIGARHEHSDGGDLRLDRTRWIIEVRSRRRAFGPDPRHFPFELALVGTQRACNRREPVAAIVLVSQSTGACVVVPSSSRPRWQLSSIESWDGQKQALYCPRGALRRFSDFAWWCRSCQAAEHRGQSVNHGTVQHSDLP